MKRWVLITTLALLAASCGPPTEPTDAATEAETPAEQASPVTIEYWHFYGEATGEALEAAVARFNAEYSGEITVESVFQGTQDDMLAKVRAAAAGGGLPQVVTARESDVTQYADADLVVPLDDYVGDPDHGLSDEELSNIYPGVLERTRLDIWDDRTLAWPFANSTAAWFYNADVLREAGFDGPPETWDDLVAASEAIVENTGVPAWVLRDDVGPWFIVVLWTHGVPWLSEDGSTPAFDSDTSVRVLTMMQEMIDAGTMTVSETAVEEFIAGRAAMTMLSSGFMGRFTEEISDFEWGVTIPPTGLDAEPITEMFGTVHSIFESTPEEELASWIFVRYMNSPEIQAQFAAGTGFFPSTRSSDQSSELQEFSENVPQFAEAIDTIAPAMELLPQSPALDEIRNTIATDVVTELLLGRLTPEEAAAKLQFEAEDVLQAAE